MKLFIIVVMTLLLTASVILPVYALDKRAQNNKNIAEFVLDTVKLPYILMGYFVKRDYEEVKRDLDYREHEGLDKCLRKQGK